MYVSMCEVYELPPSLLTIPEFLIDARVWKRACVSSGPSAGPPLTLWEGWASGWGKSQGAPLHGLLMRLALVTAMGGAVGITATALSQVTNSQVLRTIIIIPVTRVPSLRQKGGGRGTISERDARDRDRARWGHHTLLALPWSGHTHPGGAQAAGWRGSVCNTACKWI